MLKEELLGDKGYEDIHCQVVDADLLMMIIDDHFRKRILTAKSCSVHWVGNGAQ